MFITHCYRAFRPSIFVNICKAGWDHSILNGKKE